MATNPQHNRTFTTRASDPPITLLQICGRGMVFQTETQYETGTRLAVGMHMRKIRGDLGMGECEFGCTFNGDHYMNLKGISVDCEIADISPGKIVFQVTVLFDNLGRGDRRLLQRIEEERNARVCICEKEEEVVMGLN